MSQPTLPLLGGWANFYVIAGSSAGALTGLQFVVMTLIAQANTEGGAREIQAFGTPTVVHFCAALLISALMNSPWQAFSSLSYCLGTCGILGVGYLIRVIWHAHKSRYNPDLEDWCWYAALPLFAYASLAASAILLWQTPEPSLFAVAAITLLLLFIGIHNSWDTVTYIAVRFGTNPKGANGPEQKPPATD